MDVVLRDGNLFIAEEGDALRILDVSDPGNPTEVGFQDTYGWCGSVDAGEGYFFAASGSEGIYIVHNDAVGIRDDEPAGRVPTAFFLDQNHPNPFNPSTRISYSVPEKARIQLIIYDIRGRKVRTLIDDIQTSGVKTVIWDGTDDSGSSVSSGMYLYRLGSGPRSETRKMALIM